MSLIYLNRIYNLYVYDRFTPVNIVESLGILALVLCVAVFFNNYQNRNYHFTSKKVWPWLVGSLLILLCLSVFTASVYSLRSDDKYPIIQIRHINYDREILIAKKHHESLYTCKLRFLKRRYVYLANLPSSKVANTSDYVMDYHNAKNNFNRFKSENYHFKLRYNKDHSIIKSVNKPRHWYEYGSLKKE